MSLPDEGRLPEGCWGGGGDKGRREVKGCVERDSVHTLHLTCVLSSQSLVSCTISAPLSSLRRLVCRSISNSMARCISRNEFMFLISTWVQAQRAHRDRGVLFTLNP